MGRIGSTRNLVGLDLDQDFFDLNIIEWSSDQIKNNKIMITRSED
jgi:hypothetical protein